MNATKEVPLSVLAALRADAKTAEDQAIARRRNLDTEIAARLKDREEGSVTQEDGEYKIQVTYKVTRKVDTAALQKDWEFINGNVQQAFNWKAELNTKHFRALQELGVADLATVSNYITTSPASPSVTVEHIKE